MEKPWDVVIIGSGLGGITAGCLLAKAGKKVLILERHTVPGGFTHTFTRKGFEWDVGVHYVGQMENKNSILRKIFDYVSDSTLQWESMGSIYDQAIIAGDSYDFIPGVENQIQELLKSFPHEEKAIRAYYRLIQSTSGSGPWFFGEKTMPLWLSRTVGKWLRFRFAKMAKLTTWEVLHSITQNEKLISVLCTQCGDYGLPPKESSFAIHATVVGHYLNGGSYPVGGARSIHQSILSVFQKNGGTIALKSEVEEILVSESGPQPRVLGVRLKSGEIIRAQKVVSNVGVRNTFERLLNQSITDHVYEVARLPAALPPPSTTHVCLYLGLNASDEKLKLPKHNVWVFDEYNTQDRKALTYISFPSAKDPSWAARKPNRATVQVIAACAYEDVKKWENLPWAKRGAEYQTFKEKIIQELTAKLLKVVPQIQGHIEYAELSTPLSTRHFMNYQNGEIYGLAHTPERFACSLLRPETPVIGLYLAGQDVVTVGVGGALYSGVLAATKVLNKSVILRILFNWNL